MDFMKVFDQTVREIKREVNLKVLKVPEIEQKVLDATSDEPWGPHGSALSELAQATKKFSECQMIMNVLWSRLTDTGANWRHVYKSLTVIEYFIANGSERALDDILEHTFRISSLSGFEYVEPNGKDVGINVRKKVETLVALLSDKEKIKAVRDKAATTRDKYFGLSSTGITYKSSASSYGSSFQSSDHYGGFGSSPEGDSFKSSYTDGEGYDKKDFKSKEGSSSKNEGGGLKKGTTRPTRDHDSSSSNSSKTVTKPSPVLQSNNSDDDFDDFDPRGSSTGANTTSNEVDLFGESLVGDLMDAPTSNPVKTATSSPVAPPEVDLFADADFVSAPPHTEAPAGSQTNIDLFSSQPAFPAPVPTSVDLFGISESGFPSEVKYSASEPTNQGVFDPFAPSDVGLKSETKLSTLEPTNTKAFDPFAAIPMNNFDRSDLFGAFTSNTEPATIGSQQNLTNNNLSSLEQTSLTSSKPAPKKDTFQVKSGIWADSLSRGLIDLNITAPKKTNLADIGIVGGLDDVSDEKETGPPTAWNMGRAMGAGSGIGWSGLSSSTATGGSGSFSTLGQQQYGGFK